MASAGEVRQRQESFIIATKAKIPAWGGDEASSSWAHVNDIKPSKARPIKTGIAVEMEKGFPFLANLIARAGPRPSSSTTKKIRLPFRSLVNTSNTIFKAKARIKTRPHPLEKIGFRYFIPLPLRPDYLGSTMETNDCPFRFRCPGWICPSFPVRFHYGPSFPVRFRFVSVPFPSGALRFSFPV